MHQEHTSFNGYLIAYDHRYHGVLNEAVQLFMKLVVNKINQVFTKHRVCCFESDLTNLKSKRSITTIIHNEKNCLHETFITRNRSNMQ